MRTAVATLLLGIANLAFALPGLDYRSVAGNAILYDAPSLKGVKHFIIASGTPVEVILNQDNWAKVRDSAGNIAYYAFITQDDPLDRLYTAYARTSTDGTVTGGIAADGGQFTRYFPGGYYRQNGTYVAPTETGLASFAGAYVAVTNLSGSGAHLLPVPPGTDPAVLPGEAERIVGTIFLNVHFGEDNVNGAIYNRRYVDGGGSLPDIFLLPADIAADGSFLSGVVLGDHTDIGSYGGVLGSGGGAIAGVVETTGYDGNPLSEERGLFVLTRCGLPGADVEVCSVAETLGE